MGAIAPCGKVTSVAPKIRPGAACCRARRLLNSARTMSRRPRTPVGSFSSNFWSAAVFRRLHYLYALTLAFGLTLHVSRAASDDDGQSDPQETGGAGDQASSSGGAPTGGSRSAGGASAASGGRARGSGGSTSTSTGAGGQSTTAASCPTYVDDFLPQIHTPVCSKCHQTGTRLADWGVYAQAKASCTQIGSRVASGAMPPPRSGYTVTAAQKALVASWVRLGCPQTASDLPSTCN